MLKKINITLETPIATFEELADAMTATVDVNMTLQEVAEFNNLIDKNFPTQGTPTEEKGKDYANYCPRCKELFYRGEKFCSNCGQSVVFAERIEPPVGEPIEAYAEPSSDSDLIPFDSDEFDRECRHES